MAESGNKEQHKGGIAEEQKLKKDEDEIQSN